MKFIVDAQLPVRLARFLKTSGYDTIHTRDLPNFQSVVELFKQHSYIEINQDTIIVHQ
ncbi:DUF5615 family PIN-like protein [Nostoc sp. FACHB-892]|uniref:DUF5615 family PIN-like protein n=1 Tax=Nostoc sp. FACHB-892 TaxID=2692843 RepID=UPI0016879C10|nr:DUF5615 family PIN-like protein [Nostoc sp. FACHB-892]MBD2726541.1 DUF5615 family PIN-like protein [Nostoc sp. FACHB-892]